MVDLKKDEEALAGFKNRPHSKIIRSEWFP
jgi:hypothetical protein